MIRTRSLGSAFCFIPNNFSGMTSAEMNSKLETYHLKTFIPLVLFPTTANNVESTLRENVLSAISTILKQQLKLTGNLLQAIYYLIDELTNRSCLKLT